jgi:opacity protein-like surface antigen
LNRPHPMAPLALLGLALATSPAVAGEPLGSDLFAGYSYLKLDEVNRNGANLALGFRAFGPVAGFVDASTHWGSDSGLSLNDLTLMAGPGVRFGKRGGMVFFVRALAGLVRDKATISAYDVDISEGDSRFGVMAGGGVDFRVTRKLAGRAQADYLWNDVADASSSGFRVSAGVVYRFGSVP